MSVSIISQYIKLLKQTIFQLIYQLVQKLKQYIKLPFKFILFLFKRIGFLFIYCVFLLPFTFFFSKLSVLFPKKRQEEKPNCLKGIRNNQKNWNLQRWKKKYKEKEKMKIYYLRNKQKQDFLQNMYQIGEEQYRKNFHVENLMSSIPRIMGPNVGKKYKNTKFPAPEDFLNLLYLFEAEKYSKKMERGVQNLKHCIRFKKTIGFNKIKAAALASKFRNSGTKSDVKLQISNLVRILEEKRKAKLLRSFILIQETQPKLESQEFMQKIGPNRQTSRTLSKRRKNNNYAKSFQDILVSRKSKIFDLAYPEKLSKSKKKGLKKILWTISKRILLNKLLFWENLVCLFKIQSTKTHPKLNYSLHFGSHIYTQEELEKYLLTKPLPKYQLSNKEESKSSSARNSNDSKRNPYYTMYSTGSFEEHTQNENWPLSDGSSSKEPIRDPSQSLQSFQSLNTFEKQDYHNSFKEKAEEGLIHFDKWETWETWDRIDSDKLIAANSEGNKQLFGLGNESQIKNEENKNIRFSTLDYNVPLTGITEKEEEMEISLKHDAFCKEIILSDHKSSQEPDSAEKQIRKTQSVILDNT